LVVSYLAARAETRGISVNNRVPVLKDIELIEAARQLCSVSDGATYAGAASGLLLR